RASRTLVQHSIPGATKCQSPVGFRCDTQVTFPMAAFSLPRLSSKGAPIPPRRARIVSAGVVSESVMRAPDPRLDNVVVGEYQGWAESSTGVVRRREVPICAFPLIINFGAPFRFFDPARPVDGPRILSTFAAGMYDSYVIVESRGDSCCIQVNFT